MISWHGVLRVVGFRPSPPEAEPVPSAPVFWRGVESTNRWPRCPECGDPLVKETLGRDTQWLCVNRAHLRA